MIVYLDYLDHMTTSHRDYTKAAQWLRFDLLIFSRNDQICISAPACIKKKETAKLLLRIDPFWKNNKIQIQLDKKHNETPINYFKSRVAKLEKSINEQKLPTHFEYIAYKSEYTLFFFKEYFPDVGGANNITEKQHDTDILFRRIALSTAESLFEIVPRNFCAQDVMPCLGALASITDAARNEGQLFQRSVIEEEIQDNYPNAGVFASNLLDSCFSLANAETNSAIPLSQLTTHMSGRHLSFLLAKCFPDVYAKICSLSWNEVYILSQNKIWDSFIKICNEYICSMKDMAITTDNNLIMERFHFNKHISTIETIVMYLINKINEFYGDQSISHLVNNLKELIKSYFDTCHQLPAAYYTKVIIDHIEEIKLEMVKIDNKERAIFDTIIYDKDRRFILQ